MNAKESTQPDGADDERASLEPIASRIRGDVDDTPDAAIAETVNSLGALPVENQEELERIQSIVSYVDRMAQLSDAVESSSTDLGEFGKFQLVRKLGAGGFAQVYVALDPALNRLVALKIPLLRKLAQENARQRFEREAQAVALLSHPGIVPVFETGVVDSIAYIASEYCEGATLSEWISQTRKPADSTFAATLLRTLAEAIQYSHQRGIVHRDLKPTNIILSSKEADLESQTDSDALEMARSARVLDFGLAKPLSQSDMEDELTQQGDVIGTPAYMAPELVSGGETTPRSDIYSLGVILYLLLTGELPHTGESTLEILRAVESEIPKSPRQIVADVPRDLEAIVLKCLRKDPQRRYDSALELDEDLQRWLDGRPVKARQPTMFEGLQLWYRREPKVAHSLMLACLVLLIGMITTGWQWREAVRYRKDAEASLLQSLVSQKEVAESMSSHTRRTMALFQEYDEIEDWLAANPSGKGFRERWQKAAENVTAADRNNDNWMNLTDEQMTMGASLAVMMLSRQYWKQGRFSDAIRLVTEATNEDRDNRVCVGVYGGTLSFLYGKHKTERQRLIDSGLSANEIDTRRERLRLAALDCLKRGSDLGSLWLDHANWGAIFDDPDFHLIVEKSKFPIVYEKKKKSSVVSSMTKGLISRGLQGLLGGQSASSQKKAPSPKPPIDVESERDGAPR